MWKFPWISFGFVVAAMLLSLVLSAALGWWGVGVSFILGGLAGYFGMQLDIERWEKHHGF